MADGIRLRVVFAAALALPMAGQAETTGLYHPYVNRGEREFEYGLVWRDLGKDQLSLQRASFAYSWTDDVATELYLLSELPTHGDARVRGYELELRWQLTEQGEYASDWGLIFEVESGDDISRRGIAAGVLWEKELGRRFVATANALVEYEFGDDVTNEFETAFRGQLRYLKHPAFEPAVEAYFDDIDKALGPAVLGSASLSAGRKLRWEAGLLFGIDGETPDLALRAELELEF